MSRVTIKDIYWILSSRRLDSDVIWEDCKNIEVVPRKMVEMIIQECKRNEKINYAYGNYCAADNLKHIGEYAESLLKQFEEKDV